MATNSRASGTQSLESTATGSKRKSDDIGWDYCINPDPTNLDRVECILCGKNCGGGVHRMKQHIVGIPGNVTACPKSTASDKLRCRDALNTAKTRRKGKQEYNEALRQEARFGFATDETTIDVDELQDSVGGMRPPNVVGPMDNFANKINPEKASQSGKGKNKKADLQSIVHQVAKGLGVQPGKSFTVGKFWCLNSEFDKDCKEDSFFNY